MTPEDLVARVEARGESVVVRPRGVLSEAERAAFRERQRDILSHLRGRALGAEWSRVSLYQLDRILEVEIPGWDVRLILAPGCRIARELRARDERPGRIWCSCELADLVTSGVTPEDARTVAESRLIFNAEQQGVRGDDA